jgi:CBS domain-containing protein
MRIEEIMSTRLETCHPEDSLEEAARKMWEHDIGSLPVVARDGRVTSVITDRDIAMATYFRGRTLGTIKVSEVMSRRLVSVQATDELQVAEDRMRAEQVHRVPVVDSVGFLKGVITINDLAHHLRGGWAADGVSAEEVAGTVAAIGAPRLEDAASPL